MYLIVGDAAGGNAGRTSSLRINDNFKKIIITGDDIKKKINEKGIITIGLLDFLLNDDIL